MASSRKEFKNTFHNETLKKAYDFVMDNLINLNDNQVHELFCWAGYEMDQREEDNKGNKDTGDR